MENAHIRGDKQLSCALSLSLPLSALLGHPFD